MKIKPISYILFVSLGLWACGDKPAEQKPIPAETEQAHDPDGVELTSAQYETAGITLGGITTRNLSDVVTANGFIDIPPQNLVSVSAPLGGFVRKTTLLQGMKVRKGQVLAVVENPDFIQIQQDYLETESQLAYAETEYERQKELSSENVGAKKVFQQATTERRTLKARLAGLRERLRTAGIGLKALEKGEIVNHANILSPISGTVTAVNVNLGMFVNPTDVMFEVVDTDHLHVELSIFEQDISKVKIGQKVRYTVADGDGREGIAEVYLINPKINEDRTVRVHCHLEGKGPRVLPHNYVKATIETGSNPVPSLPDQAVMDFAGKSYVFVGKDREGEKKASAAHLFEMVEVQKGVSEGGYTQVTLPDDVDRAQARVVVKGAYALLSKMKNSEEEEGH